MGGKANWAGAAGFQWSYPWKRTLQAQKALRAGCAVTGIGEAFHLPAPMITLYFHVIMTTQEQAALGRPVWMEEGLGLPTSAEPPWRGSTLSRKK